MDIEEVASELQLTLKRSNKELRGQCPVCNSNDERALAIMPETNSFRCYAAQVSGDVIALVAHVEGIRMYAAATKLQEQFRTPEGDGKVTAPTPTPQKKPQAASSQPAESGLARHSSVQKPPKVDRPFDPDQYAAKLQYTDEISALGITEEDAARLGIGYAATGFHRGSVVIAIRNPDGTIAGFAGVKDGELKLPTKWLAAKVVEFKRRA